MTLSNYTQNAQKYLDNTPIIRGINGTELVDLVLKYYDQLSVKYRKMIPLKCFRRCYFSVEEGFPLEMLFVRIKGSDRY